MDVNYQIQIQITLLHYFIIIVLVSQPRYRFQIYMRLMLLFDRIYPINGLDILLSSHIEVGGGKHHRCA